MKKPRMKSSFQMVRLSIDAAELAGDVDVKRVGLRASGVFWRLLPYACETGLPLKVSHLAALANVTPEVLRRAWPKIEHLFERRDTYWRLRPRRWLRVSRITVSRTTLRQLFGRLVEFWGHACVYCGVDDVDLHIDHVIPLARGGTNDITNLTLACRACNSKKRMQTAAEFGFAHIQERAVTIQ